MPGEGHRCRFDLWRNGGRPENIARVNHGVIVLVMKRSGWRVTSSLMEPSRWHMSTKRRTSRYTWSYVCGIASGKRSLKSTRLEKRKASGSENIASSTVK